MRQVAAAVIAFVLTSCGRALASPAGCEALPPKLEASGDNRFIKNAPTPPESTESREGTSRIEVPFESTSIAMDLKAGTIVVRHLSVEDEPLPSKTGLYGVDSPTVPGPVSQTIRATIKSCVKEDPDEEVLPKEWRASEIVISVSVWTSEIERRSKTGVWARIPARDNRCKGQTPLNGSDTFMRVFLDAANQPRYFEFAEPMVTQCAVYGTLALESFDYGGGRLETKNSKVKTTPSEKPQTPVIADERCQSAGDDATALLVKLNRGYIKESEVRGCVLTIGLLDLIGEMKGQGMIVSVLFASPPMPAIIVAPYPLRYTVDMKAMFLGVRKVSGKHGAVMMLPSFRIVK